MSTILFLLYHYIIHQFRQKDEKYVQKIELKKVFTSNEWSSSVVTCLDWSLQVNFNLSNINFIF